MLVTVVFTKSKCRSLSTDVSIWNKAVSGFALHHSDLFHMFYSVTHLSGFKTNFRRLKKGKWLTSCAWLPGTEKGQSCETHEGWIPGPAQTMHSDTAALCVGLAPTEQ